MVVLTKGQMLGGAGRVYKNLEVPDLGGAVRLGSLTAGPALALQDLLERQKKGEAGIERQLMQLLLVSCVVDESNKPVFDAESASQFIDAASVETIGLITNSIPSKAPAVTPGNSEASPAAASPSV